MHPYSRTWDEVEHRFREIHDRYQSMAPMAARMLHLVAVLRLDPRFEHLGRNDDIDRDQTRNPIRGNWVGEYSRDRSTRNRWQVAAA